MQKKITVFCSASNRIGSGYNVVARDFVRAASLRGYTIVSGGTVKGTMGEISDEINRCGGNHIGIIPRFMEGLEYPDMTETIWTDTMAERKELMRKDVCAVVALPGGIGTLDELIETLTLKKLGQFDGKIFALDHEGFYRPLAALLDHYLRTGMMDQASRDDIIFLDSPEAILEAL